VGFFFSSRRRHTSFSRDWSSDVCSSDLSRSRRWCQGGANDAVEHAAIAPPWHHLRDLLLETGRIEPIRDYDERYLAIRTPDVLEIGRASCRERVGGSARAAACHVESYRS